MDGMGQLPEMVGQRADVSLTAKLTFPGRFHTSHSLSTVTCTSPPTPHTHMPTPREDDRLRDRGSACSKSCGSFWFEPASALQHFPRGRISPPAPPSRPGDPRSPRGCPSNPESAGMVQVMTPECRSSSAVGLETGLLKPEKTGRKQGPSPRPSPSTAPWDSAPSWQSRVYSVSLSADSCGSQSLGP